VYFALATFDAVGTATYEQTEVHGVPCTDVKVEQ
jgi:hypothetical protein